MKFIFIIILLYIIPIIICNDSSLLVPDSEDNNDDNQKGMFNFASHAAGAVILDKSPSNAKGFSNLLNDDKDKYAIASCSEKKWVVIGLSEDILVKTVVVANYEKYSSQLRNFQLLASTNFPTDQWINLGTYQAEARLGEQVFEVTNSSSHTRYLKFKFMTHYDDEALCTLSQIKVHGTTVIASFQEEVKISEATMRDMLSQLNLDETIQKTDEKNESDSTLSSIPSVQEGDNQQTLSVKANDNIVTDVIDSIILNENNSTNTDNLDQSKSTEEVVVTTSNENEISIVDIIENTIKLDSDIETVEISSGNIKVDGLHEPIVGITTNEDNTSKSSDEGSKIVTNSNSTVEEIKNVAANDDIKESTNTEIESVSADDKGVSETIPITLPVEIDSHDNKTINEDVHQEDKGGPSLMQTIAESTVHAVKEIVLAPLRQIPKPKIQHGKQQTNSGPLNEVQENLFGIASKNDDVTIEKIVIPDKLVTNIKDIDTHAANTRNRQVVQSSEPDISIQPSDNNTTPVVMDEAEVISNYTTVVKSEPEPLSTIESEEKISKENTENTVEQSTEINAETTVQHSNVQSNDNIIDFSAENTSSSSSLSQAVEVDEKGKSSQNITSIIEIVSSIDPSPIIEIDNATTITTIDVNVSTSHNVTLSSSTILPDNDNDKFINLTASVTGAINSLSIDNNITTAIIDTIDIIERKSNDLILTASKKNPILQPTSSRTTSSPPLPSNCLETLKFVDFQAKMVSKLVNASDDKDRSVPLTSQDNVFRHLMQKIKMLEMNYAIIEMYSIQIGDCYRSVLNDLTVNVTTSLQLASTAVSSAAISAEVLTNISYNRPIKFDNLKLTGGDGIINKDRDKVIIDGLENILLRYNEDDVIQLIAVALILGLLSLFVSCAIGLFTFFQLRKHYSK